MANGFFKFILPVAIFYGLCIPAGAGTDEVEECFGETIVLEPSQAPGAGPDFYSRFEADVTASWKSSQDQDKASCPVVSDIKAIREGSAAVLVDVRNSAKKAELAITDIVDIPLHELKTKEFLKKRPLVLFDDAYRYYELLDECELLKSLGFKQVSVFSGDLDSLSRPDPDTSHYHYIDAPVFHALKQKWRWLVFDLTESKHKSAFSNLVPLSFAADKQLLSSKIERGIEAFHVLHGFYPQVLIMDTRGQNYPLIRDALAEKYRRHVFYLRNGIDGYRNFALQQDEILEQKRKIQNRSLLPCGAIN